MKTQPTTTVRPFTSDDYAAVIGVSRASYPDYTESLAEWRHWDETWDAKKYFTTRVVAEDRGRIVGWGQLNHSPWAFVENKYRIDVTVLPDFRRRGHGSAVHDELVAIAKRRSGIAVQAAAKESYADGVAFLARRGYEERKRDWESRLYVRTFDFSRFDGAQSRVSEQAIRISSLAAERATDPDALRKAYAVTEETGRDVPTVDPHTSRPFDEWLTASVEAPNALLDAYFLAIDRDGRYLGLSNLFASLDDPTFLWQGLTGVLRDSRGRGIAMALKLQTVRYALAKGVEHIKTWNDVNNRPMLAINEAMGFARQPAWITYEKDLSAASRSQPSS